MMQVDGSIWTSFPHLPNGFFSQTTKIKCQFYSTQVDDAVALSGYRSLFENRKPKRARCRVASFYGSGPAPIIQALAENVPTLEHFEYEGGLPPE